MPRTMHVLPEQVIETAPPLNERGLVELVCPKHGATVLLTADENEYLPSGGFRVARKGEKIEFRNSRAQVTPEQFRMLVRHPAYTGSTEPKIIFLAHERAVVDGAGGPQVVDGAMSSSMGRAATAPLRDWDKMTNKAIRAAVRQGLVTQPADALAYENAHRKRPGVILVLASAIAGPLEKIPTATTMAKVDRDSGIGTPAASEPTDEPEDDGDDYDLVAELPTDDEIRSDLQAEIAAAIDAATPEGDLDDGEDEPAPEEGVL